MDRGKQLAERNIELAAEFSRYLFEHPEVEERIATGAEIILLPEFDDELREYNLQVGRQVAADGAQVVYVTIKQLRPRTLSRIEGIGLEAVV
jgi:hypothetical protein